MKRQQHTGNGHRTVTVSHFRALAQGKTGWEKTVKRETKGGSCGHNCRTPSSEVTMEKQEFAALLRTLRAGTGRTQEQQAEEVNRISGRGTMTRREIVRYEKGDNIPTKRTLAYFSRSFGLPPEELEEKAKYARARRRKDTAGRGKDEDMRRRTLLAGGAAAMGTAAAAEPWERLARALRGGTVDSTLVGSLVERACELHVRERRLTASSLQSEVEQHLDVITSALGRAGEYERPLTVVGGETAALAGWVAWDAGQYERARHFYRVAMQCADSAGHPLLRALVLGYASYGASTPEKAVILLEQASEHVRGAGAATASAWIYGRLAEESANSGDEAGALRALDRAHISYEFADHASEQAWVRFVTPYRMDSLALSVYGQLGRPELSETADRAARRLGDELPDSGVVVLGDLASALLRGGDTEQGVLVSHQFAAAVEVRPTTMGRTRAQTVAQHLPAEENELGRHLMQLAS
ncbi:helix-turn-helix transcriptional regulator [Streptomyces griseoviridis]|uniref:helix-turn-helix transcriptional regulator n=1 Tax=Streptomyces griseoviridis TaxID=45398 RepID=UPI00344C3510